MTIRRLSISGGVPSVVESTSERIGATCAKLMQRRSTLLSKRRTRPRRSHSLPFDGCGIDASLCSASSHLRRSSEPQSTGRRRSVTFSMPLITDVRFRPYTTPEEKPLLFYSRAEIAIFKARRHIRERTVQFADPIVTEVREAPALVCCDEEEEARGRLYYSTVELQGFLKEFLAALDNGESDSDLYPVEEDASARLAIPAEDADFVEIPLDDDCERVADADFVTDNETDSDSGSDSDDGSASSDDLSEELEEEALAASSSAVVWPAPQRDADPFRRGAVSGGFPAECKAMPAPSAAACCHTDLPFPSDAVSSSSVCMGGWDADCASMAMATPAILAGAS